LSMLALPQQQRASSVHCQLRADSGVQGGRYARATPRQVGSGARHGRITGPSRSAAFCCAAVDPVGRAVSAAGAQPHAAAPPDARGTARLLRGSCPRTTDPALVRGRALGDGTSLELLDLTVERVRQLPVFALFTFRPEFEPPWVGLPNVGTLTLGRLDRNDVESMVAQVTGGRVLPAEVMKQIVAKT